MTVRDEQLVFLSASIPDPERWDKPFEPFEITDAVVALTSALLTAGWTIITAAHPTIAPLILHVGAELHTMGDDMGHVRLYQTDLFEDHIPEATTTLVEQEFVTVEWTAKVEGEEPRFGRWHESLAVMRRQMFEENEIDAAVFVGGMGGIHEEWALLGDLRPHAARIPIWGPGGAAATLDPPSELAQELTTSRLYPYLSTRVLDYLRRRATR